MTIWKFDEHRGDFIRARAVVHKATPNGVIYDGGIYLMAEEDPELLFGCMLYLDEGGGCTRLIAPEERTFTVGGVEFERGVFERRFYEQHRVELRVRKRLAELMLQVRQHGRVL